MEIKAGDLLASRYEARALLGKGGMGEVWHCFDLDERREVAVKTVLAEHLGAPALRRLFQAEVIAVARLSHPGIVEVYDLLQQPDGSSLLVMAYRPGKSLDVALKSTPSWSLVRTVLVQLLEALAHAHARSVLHLDIKPANILVERSEDALRTTLVDFGIARIKRPGRGAERWFERDMLVGTLEYMAPEQCCGEVEKLGPWTDLYALGMMLYELSTGELPYLDEDPASLMRRRLEERAPALVPRVRDVPAGVADLCARLLALEPRDRPWCAADVLAELQLIDPSESRRRSDLRGLSSRPPPDSFVGSSPEGSLLDEAGGYTVALADPASAATMALRGDAAPTEIAEQRIATVLAELLQEAEPRSAPVSVPASIPASSSRGVPSSHSKNAEEMGEAFTAEARPPTPGAYGLFGLRELPVMGRVAERQAIWSAVRATALEGRPSAVLLSGPAGTGKSRLARDAAERALELGLSTLLYTHWSQGGSADEGARGLIENVLESRGAVGAEFAARLGFWLERIPGEHEGFAREVRVLLRPESDAAPDAGLPVRAAADTVARAGALRPVLLWLDDVQWSRGEAAALVSALATLEPQPAVCVIATVRDEGQRDDDALSEAMAKLCGEGPAIVSMRPLGEEAAATLARGLLDLDEELLSIIVRRSEGNPLFVTQFVRQLVLERAIERKGGRYALCSNIDVDGVLPADIGAVWQRRVALSGAAERDLQALAVVRERVSSEIAVALGALAGPTFTHSLHRALAAGLLEQKGELYAWTHGLLRDFLVGRVSQERGPRIHGWAAEALLPLVGREDVQEERAQHLWRAQAKSEACDAMLDGAMWSWRRAERDPRERRLVALEGWARETGLRDMEARALAETAYLYAEAGRFEEANQGIDKARERLESDEGSAAAWIWFRVAQTVRLQGRADEGSLANRRAIDLGRVAKVPEVELLSIGQLGIDEYRKGDIEAARTLFGTMATMARGVGNRGAEARAMMCLRFGQPPSTAQQMVSSAVELARAAGALQIELQARQVWVDALWDAGERMRARQEAAALSAEAARRMLRQTVSLVELQAAIWAVAEDDWSAAAEHRQRAGAWGATGGAIVERAVSAALDLVLALARGDEAGAAVALARVRSEGRGFSEAGFRNLLGKARRIASPAFEHEIAAL